MQDEIFYKGYLIKTVPLLLVDTNKWTTNVQITKGQRSYVYESYSASNTWDTRNEAVNGSINMGIDIIEGKIPDFQLKNEWI